MQLNFGEKESMQKYIDTIPTMIGLRIIQHSCSCSECIIDPDQIQYIECTKCSRQYYRNEDGVNFEDGLDMDDVEKFLEYRNNKCYCGNRMELTKKLVRRLSSLRTR